MLFMGGLIGKIFSEFAITLTAITIISGFNIPDIDPYALQPFYSTQDKR